VTSGADRYLADAGPAGVFTRLTRVGLFLDAFQHRCLDRFNLRFVDYSLLRVLQIAGEPVTPGELTDLLLRSSGGITQILDRLERAKLVKRSTDRGDRRRVLVELTDSGLRRAKEANAAYATERDRILGHLSKTDVKQLDAAVRRLLDVLGAELAEP
jgi:DNA-binding MarR family transcriptional regulator